MFENDTKNYLTVDPASGATLRYLERDRSGLHSFVLETGGKSIAFRARILLVADGLIDWDIISVGSAFGPKGMTLGTESAFTPETAALVREALTAFGAFFGRGNDVVRNVVILRQGGQI